MEIATATVDKSEIGNRKSEMIYATGQHCIAVRRL